MRIILVPDNTGKRYNTSLNHRQVILIGALLGVVMPVVLGVAAYRFSAAFDQLEQRNNGAVAITASESRPDSGTPARVDALVADEALRAGIAPQSQTDEPVAGLVQPQASGRTDVAPIASASAPTRRATRAVPDLREISRLEINSSTPGVVDVIDQVEPLPLTAVDLREIQDLRGQLREHRDAIADTQRTARHHLDAMALRLGHIQAQIARIDALGSRLTEMAGLERGEFDFGVVPALGGPEVPSALEESSAGDLTRTLEALSDEIESRYSQLEVLESLLMDHEMHKALYPTGWPIQGGWISSNYGYRTDPFTGRRTFHAGVDIANKPGTPIKAMAAGVISFSGVRAGYGLLVEINHGNGYTTRYAHALATLVKTGQRVERGQTVAVVGTSGRSTGPHLHFEVIRNGRTVDPMKYLQANR